MIAEATKDALKRYRKYINAFWNWGRFALTTTVDDNNSGDINYESVSNIPGAAKTLKDAQIKVQEYEHTDPNLIGATSKFSLTGKNNMGIGKAPAAETNIRTSGGIISKTGKDGYEHDK